MWFLTTTLDNYESTLEGIELNRDLFRVGFH